MASIKLPPNADVNFVSDLRDQLIVSSQSQNDLVIDASGVENVSTPLLQILLVLINHTKEHSISFSLKKPSESFIEAIRNFGCFEAFEEVIT